MHWRDQSVINLAWVRKIHFVLPCLFLLKRRDIGENVQGMPLTTLQHFCEGLSVDLGM